MVVVFVVVIMVCHKNLTLKFGQNRANDTVVVVIVGHRNLILNIVVAVVVIVSVL